MPSLAPGLRRALAGRGPGSVSHDASGLTDECLMATASFMCPSLVADAAGSHVTLKRDPFLQDACRYGNRQQRGVTTATNIIREQNTADTSPTEQAQKNCSKPQMSTETI